MAARWPILVGAVAISGGIAWFALRDGGTSSRTDGKIAPEASGSPAGTTPTLPGSGATGRTGKIDIVPVQRPQATQGSAELPAPNTAFEAQDRDAAWASNTEGDIRARVRQLRGGKLDAVECRQDQCLLTMSGSEEEISRSISELETQAGLRDYADHILLTGPEPRDGKLSIKVYASFDRRAKPEN